MQMQMNQLCMSEPSIHQTSKFKSSIHECVVTQIKTEVVKQVWTSIHKLSMHAQPHLQVKPVWTSMNQYACTWIKSTMHEMNQLCKHNMKSRFWAPKCKHPTLNLLVMPSRVQSTKDPHIEYTFELSIRLLDSLQACHGTTELSYTVHGHLCAMPLDQQCHCQN